MSGHGQRGNSKDEGQQTRPRRMMGRGPHGGGAVEKAKDARGAFNRLVSYLGDYKALLVVISVLTAASSLLALAGPYLIGVAIDTTIITGDIPGLVRISTLLAGI